ncbi:MAG TPA: MFS transporter [Steroidobacteraceae bacterium]|nr:MFS transporter [Steroidobacteraceae bacterium]
MNSADARHPLFNREFRYLWIGNTVSGCGDQFFLVALPWLILQLTGSGAVLGGIMMVEAIPRAALMLIGGAVTDRVSPRKIMIFTAACRSFLVAALAALIWMNHVEVWQLYVLSFCFGVADAFAAPAAQTLLPSLVAPAQLPAANALSQGTQQVAMLTMPAPAGIIIAAFGVASAFSIDAVSFLFIIAALFMLRDPPRVVSAAPRSNIAHSILEGLRYVKNDVALRSLLLVVSVLNFCITGPLSVGLAFLAKSEFGSPTAYGLLISSVAAGSLVGLVLAGARQQRKRGWLLLVVSALIGIFSATIGLLSQMWSLLPILFVISAAAGFLNVHLLAWFQQRVDRAMLGRVMSVLMFASLGLMPLSLAAAGIAVQWNVRGMFAAAGALVLVVTSVAALQRPVREID